MELENKVIELSNAIMESEDYKKYLSAKNEIEENQDLLARVNEYRKKNFFIQNSDSMNKIEEIRKLVGEYYDVLSNKLVKDYLEAELVLCRCIQNINNIMMEKLDFDVSFIG